MTEVETITVPEKSTEAKSVLKAMSVEMNEWRHNSWPTIL